ncbi:SAMD9 [Mytilus edulis]|uniref:SAMD9 n=1 Tax=Mytilus edulis TaxID=6550 RepID=A0A8S3TPQ2_MYTED|nr:SAMD9 [Mytilus edulis]
MDKNANAGKIKTENLRRFDRPASEQTKYKHGSKFPIKDGRPGNLISPVHKYFMFENKGPPTSDSMNSFCNEVVNFAAACMNERSNGTFHAGISESGIIIGCEIDVTSVDSTITKAIRQQFKDYQVETVLRCVRCPQFIEVVGSSQTQEKINVIEIDVIPYSGVVGNQNFYVINTNKLNTIHIFYRYLNGEVMKQNASEVDEFIEREKKLQLSKGRKIDQKR